MPRARGGDYGRGPGMGQGPGGHGPMQGPPMGRPPRRGWGWGPYRRGGCMGCLCTFLLGTGGLAALLALLFSFIF